MKMCISTVDEYGVTNYKNWFLFSSAMAILFGWIAIAAFGLVAAEVGVEGANVHNYGDAFWLLFMSASTVGYGDFFSVSLEARLIVGATFLVGVGVAGYIGSILASAVLGFSDTNVKNRALQSLLVESLEQDCETLKQVQVNEHHILALEEKLKTVIQLLESQK